MIERGLPLLQRELIEQSGRRRTYFFRSLFAAVCFAIMLGVVADYARGADDMAILGRGKDVFIAVLFVGFFTIYLYLPAMCCGLITAEKERDTLQLLFLTRLSPWAIVFEKLLSRLTPFMFLLLSVLPAMMICFAIGGLEQELVWSSAYTLMLAAVQIASVAIFASSFCRTTTAAFVMTYLVGVAVFVIPLAIGYFSHEFFGGDGEVTVYGVRYSWFLALTPPALNKYARNDSLQAVLVCSVPIVFSCIGFLYLAKHFLVSRASSPVGGSLLRRVEAKLTKARVLLGRGKRLRAVRDNYPQDDPVAWREQTKTLFGCFRYQVMVALFMCAMIIGVLLFMSLRSNFRIHDYFDVGVAVRIIAWVIALFVVVLKAGSLFSSERTKQTLEVLLTSPLTNAELLAEKMRSVKSLIRCMYGVLVFQMLVTLFSASGYHRFQPFVYFCFCLVNPLILLRIFADLAVMIGLKFKKQMTSLLVCVSLVVGWCVLLPALTIVCFEATGVGPSDRQAILLLASPVYGTLCTATGDLQNAARMNSVWTIPCLHLFFYSLLAVGTSQLRKKSIGMFLGRRDAMSG